MGVNLDELERLAKKANDDEFNSDTNWIEYQDAANPETVLKLIAELRALRRVAEVVTKFVNTVGHSEDCATERDEDDGSECNCWVDSLDIALAEWRKGVNDV